MPNTFGGEHHRPRDPQRSNSRRQLADWASYDNQPQTSCLGCLLIATILTTAATAIVRLRK